MDTKKPTAKFFLYGFLVLGLQFQANAQHYDRIGRVIGDVFALTPDSSNGFLYAGGYFSKLDSNNKFIDLSAVSKWDGKKWTIIANSISGVNTLNAMAMYKGNLIVGGNFTNIDGQRDTGIAMWDGNKWNNIGTIHGNVRCMFVYKDCLYIGGAISYINSLKVNNLAKWDGQTWSATNVIINSDVRCLASFHDSLIVGGDFHIFFSDGIKFTEKLRPQFYLHDYARGLCVYKGELYIYSVDEQDAGLVDVYKYIPMKNNIYDIQDMLSTDNGARYYPFMLVSYKNDMCAIPSPRMLTSCGNWMPMDTIDENFICSTIAVWGNYVYLSALVPMANSDTFNILKWSWRNNDEPLSRPQKIKTAISDKNLVRTKILVSWTNSATNADGIILQRSTKTGVFYNKTFLSPNATSYIDTIYNADSIYSYRLQCLDKWIPPCDSYSDTSSINLTNSSIDPGQNSLEQMNIYPIPAKGYLVIKSTQSISKIEIVEIIGKVISETEVADNNAMEKTINISNVRPGSYFIKVITNGGVECQKAFIKN